MRHVIDDTVLISDGEVDSGLAEKLVSFLESNFHYEEGMIGKTLSEKTKYRSVSREYSKVKIEKKSPEESDFVNHLIDLKMIPIIPKHRLDYVCRVHEMEEGGQMDWHDDNGHSLAVSYYLSECVGGELEVVLDRNDDCDIERVIRLSPKTNRIVVMKGANMHRVLPVESGKRKSVQIFIEFFKPPGGGA